MDRADLSKPRVRIRIHDRLWLYGPGIHKIPRRNPDELSTAFTKSGCSVRSGERDITAHVAFTALEEHGKLHGLKPARLETLARTLLDAGEVDQFAAALAGPDERSRRLQLKTLLFGMGETFRTLLQAK